MIQQLQKTSIRKVFISAVVLVTIICLSLSIAVVTYLDSNTKKQVIKSEIEMIADIIAFNSQVTLLFDDSDSESERLSSFANIDLIKNIHIYSIDSLTKKPEFFVSFNAPKTPPVSLKIDRIAELSQATFSRGFVEIIKPVTFESETLGYIYIRGSTDRLTDYIQTKVIIDIVIALIVLLCVVLVAIAVSNRIAKPIQALSTLLQVIAKDHNYQRVANKSNISEINMLANSLNSMLARTKNQLERHQADKQEIKQLNLNLEEKVNNRTIALRDANQELLSTLEKIHQYQNQIIENEKMASLGQMVAGVAHEVNTPIGLGVTGSTLLRDKLVDLKTAFEAKKLTSKQMEKFINDGIENLDLIYRNLNRAADLVASFKQVDVSQGSEQSSKINLNDLLNSIAKSMAADLNVKKANLVVSSATELNVISKIGPIQQIFEQLVSNSLIHGFVKADPKNIINILLKAEDEQLCITYQDNGLGVSRAVKQKIFDPFVTTKRGEGGSGLGMHMVYNLVTQGLGGNIALDDEYKDGAGFKITLPLEAQS